MATLNNILVRLAISSRSIVAMALLALTFVGCQFEPYSPYISKAELPISVLTYQATTISGTTNGEPKLSWDIQITQGIEFCVPKQISGSVGSSFSLSFSENDSEDIRIAKIRIEFDDGYSEVFTVRQYPKTANPEYDRAWAEQPERKEGIGLVHKSYYTYNAVGQRVRNYSICYDSLKLVSHWVAYPLHDCYIGGSGRTNEWSFDDYYYTKSGEGYKATYMPTLPVIPTSRQANIKAGGYGSGYDRGHILPSASRTLDYNTNAQTFYATNMMPQQSRFNQNIWADLEDRVRGWRCSDTLFVVTGTLFEGAAKSISANGRTIAVPSHAYKVILRTKRGNSGKNIAAITSADELKSIGFIFSNDSKGADTSIVEAVVSVSDIEQRSGFKFFRNLNPTIAEEVKSQKNLSDWGL